MTNFQYNIVVNQKAVIDNNIDVDIIDVSIMNFLWNFQASNKVKKLEDGWFWAAGSEIIKQIPIIGIKTTRGINKRIDKLVSTGLLERHPDNQQMRQSFYRITQKYETVFQFATRNESSKHLEQEFQVTRNESSDYYNTIDNNTNNNRKNIKKEMDKSLPLAASSSDTEADVQVPPEIEAEYKWITENTPTLLKMRKPLTVKQIEWYKNNYPDDVWNNVFQQMENKIDLQKKYSSANLTAQNWLRRSGWVSYEEMEQGNEYAVKDIIKNNPRAMAIFNNKR